MKNKYMLPPALHRQRYGKIEHYFEDDSVKKSNRAEVIQCIESYGLHNDGIIGFTLPGRSFKFERMLLEKDYVNKIICCECNIHVLREMKSVPRKVDLFECFANKLDPIILRHVNFVWMDYCCLPSVEYIEYMCNFLNCNRKIIYFLTFCLNVRCRGGYEEWFINHLNYNQARVHSNNIMELKRIVDITIDNISEKILHKKLVRIYDNQYKNDASVNMLTLGFMN